MSWGAVIVGGAALVGGYMSSQSQSSAAKKAANAQASAASSGTNAQLQMWSQARTDFAPYLNAGSQGLYGLQTAMPNYIQNTLTPIAQQYGNFTPQALPSAGFSINPVTGQMSTTGQQAAAPAYSLAQQPTGRVAPTTSGTSRTAGMTAADQQRFNAGEYGTPVQDIGAFLASPTVSEGLKDMVRAQMATGTPGQRFQVAGPEGSIYAFQQPGGQADLQFNQGQAQTQAPYSLAAPASQADLAAGGVLSPAVPELYRGMENVPVPESPELFRSLADYQFNTQDPVYQQKLAEKNAAIDTFLAKQGLQGSSAGESFRQGEINKLLAEEEQRQYDRALTERNYGTQTAADQFGLDLTRSNTLYGRGLEERNYGTQTAMDQYQLAAARGDTLYNRLYGQSTDMYNRQLQNTLLANEQNQGVLANQYNIAKDIYGLQYAGSANLANMGSSAAGLTGQQAIATGQGIASNAQYSGNALAQGYLASGQANAANWQNLAGVVGGVASNYMYNQATNPQTIGSGYYNQYYGYTPNYSAANYGNTTGLNMR